MADDEQDGEQGQNQGAMSSTPSRSPGMQNNRQGGGGGGACVGECIRKPRIPDIGIKDLSDPRFGAMLFAEVLGTFFLVFIGCGSIKKYGPAQIYSKDRVVVDPDGKSAPSYGTGENVMIAFAFGITVATIAQAIGHVSGAHLNPAVSFGLVAAGQCSLLKAVFYSIAQIVGAVLANIFLYLLTQSVRVGKDKSAESEWDLGVSMPTVPAFNAFVVEILLTFLLVILVCGVCDEERKDIKGSAPLAIGMTVFVCHVMGMQYSGSSINPARSIGPLVLNIKDVRKDAFEFIWIYLFGPLIGGVMAGAVYQLFFREKQSGSDSRSVAPAQR